MFGQGFVGRQDAGRLAGFGNAQDGGVDGFLHHRVRGFQHVTQAGRKVGRADEDAVHAVNGSNGFNVVQRGLGFGLYQQANLRVGFFGILRHPAKLASPRHGHAAHATCGAADIVVLWVPRGAHQLQGLRGGVDHRGQQSLKAQIQELLDQHLGHCATALRNTPDGMAGREGRNRLQLLQQGARLGRGVFGVHQQPVKTRARADFGGITVGQAQPQANLGLLVLEGGFEGVNGCFHKNL